MIDNQSVDIKGPLLGVLSAHSSNPEEDLFLLGCDMLLIEIKFLEKLIRSFRADDTFDAYIFKTKFRVKIPIDL
ncbi:hypothetical protein [Pedobacter zeae]|uniref:Molybdopterin-guanine dinucleotide biosynthesis protein A n=1 Tax=Pedobacter zeae TaxID=1737356 RepID=A0A7W6K7L3_9SPHI|nr:hypothetical protein [Pedobacter zeae]MBB4106683.1 molybdopterin-guanine dinucleotide biosynthesis protein A [Pedobacter zeae]GGH03137.1 hypothetical protein GCM10007422_17970 [Pedobacter zeae]